MKCKLYSEEYFDSPDFKAMESKTGRDKVFCLIAYTPETLELLNILESLKDVNKCDKQGLSYLHMAAQTHKLKTIEILLRKGANPNCVDNHNRLAILAAIGIKNENNAAILKLFLQYGLDLEYIINGITLKEMILSFGNEEYNTLIE